MKIQTFSIVVGTSACNAKCPFCVSKMTHAVETLNHSDAHWRNFDIAVNLAKTAGATTAMLTGKGEPTLYPDLITKYIDNLKHAFPLVEIQTNGLLLQHPKYLEHLQTWYHQGVTTIAISVTHWDDEINRQVYCPNIKYPKLEETIKLLHDIGFSVRLNCIMTKGRVDNKESVCSFIDFARANKVEQVTLMPVNRPSKSNNEDVYNWVFDNHVEKNISTILAMLETDGSLLMELAHGAMVFDYRGQNVCLSNCLKVEPIRDKTIIRNLIFFPDGHLRYDWEHEGAIIL